MDEYTSSVRVWGLTCPGFPEEVGRARRWTRDILRDRPCVDDAALIVSELGANAVLHTASGDGTGTFHVSLAVAEQVVAVSVTDAGGAGTVPKMEHPDEEADHGRGLGMVTTLASHVAVHASHHGHTVTAELLTPRPGSRPC